jgi:D-alanyl-lipoteichoic acid acyltransferase DltB (MBOAT superfamily)
MGEVWLGVLAYTLQLYFDFSGYSDMAIGLARLFGIRLPMNFNSPYKAANIAEFWRRWHITLSRFLRDYIYIPLGGNRRGNARKYTNLFVTMLIGGIWHGAGWTFVVWGALHGTYLLIYHVWRDRKADSTHHAPRTTHQQSTADSARMTARRFFAHASTFLAIVIAWVFFRADSFQAATNVLISMTGFHGLTSDLARLHQSNGWVLVIPLLLAVWFCRTRINCWRALRRHWNTSEPTRRPGRSRCPLQANWRGRQISRGGSPSLLSP